MEIKPGLSAFITGAASGIGKALSLALAAKGVFVAVVDFSEDRGKEVASLVEKENSKFHSSLRFPSALFIKCDVSNSGDVAAAFEKHVATYGGLDICINCAGIANRMPIDEDQTDGTRSWRHTLNVNLLGVIDCTRHAIRIMQTTPSPGVIVNLGSAAGLYPYSFDPVYGASKAGVVMFTRSLALDERQGIRVNVLCPEFVETVMTSMVPSKLINMSGGFIPMKMIIEGAFELITDDSKAGSCLWITNRRGLEYWPGPDEEAKSPFFPSSFRKSAPFKAMAVELPKDFEKIVVHTLSHNFRKATQIIRTPLRFPIEPHQVLVKLIYAGVNASDVKFTSGSYFSNSQDTQFPFDAGFEAVGIIAAVGEAVTHLKVGTPSAIMTYGSYAEFVEVPSKHVLPVPRPDPEVVAMLISGLTASIALPLEQAGRMESGKSVLVTAAAGGTGQFAVQLAKLAGNRVVATCGGKEKAALLKRLGVDRVIDYEAEDVKTVLKKEFPKGIDIIYESVGGDMFDICLNALAIRGRLIIIGMISQYQGKHGWAPSNYTGLCEKILAKSQTVAGFFLTQYAHLWKQHLLKLFDLYSAGKLKISIDPRRFLGIQSVADAVEYLHSSQSVGKVVVCIDPSFSTHQARL